MTIRDVLKRRARLPMSGVLVLALVAGAAGAMAKHGRMPLWFAGFIFLLFVGAFGWILQSVRCPRCNSNLASVAAHFGPLAFLSRQPPSFCPFCGVCFDEKAENPPDSPA